MATISTKRIECFLFICHFYYFSSQKIKGSFQNCITLVLYLPTKTRESKRINLKEEDEMEEGEEGEEGEVEGYKMEEEEEEGDEGGRQGRSRRRRREGGGKQV